MKETTYKKDSWAYRINTSHNMLIPHINQRYDYDENGHYAKMPPVESCTYWQNVLLYLCLQVPMLFIFGLACAFMGLFLPLTAIVFYFSTFVLLPESWSGIAILVVYAILGIVFFCFNTKTSKYIKPVLNEVFEMYDCLKEKYCKKLNFK